ncbi:hypothetical protein D3C81_1101450 [compost metagenome]
MALVFQQHAGVLMGEFFCLDVQVVQPVRSGGVWCFICAAPSQLGAVQAGGWQAQWGEQCIELRDAAPTDQGQCTVEVEREYGQQVRQIVGWHHLVRMVGKCDQGAIDIKKQRIVVRQRRWKRSL